MGLVWDEEWAKVIKRYGTKGTYVAFLDGRLDEDEERIFVECMNPQILLAVAHWGSGAATQRMGALQRQAMEGSGLL